MILYYILSSLKVIVGSIIVYYLYNYVNIFQDIGFGVIFGFVGIFLITVGISFFVFLVFNLIFLKKSYIKKVIISYKLSFLFGLFVLFNLGLILIESWNKFIGFSLLIFFIFLQIIFTYE